MSGRAEGSLEMPWLGNVYLQEDPFLFLFFTGVAVLFLPFHIALFIPLSFDSMSASEL